MYNQIPCIAEVNRLIKLDNSNSSLVCEVNAGLSQSSGALRNSSTQAQLFEHYKTTGAAQDIFFLFVYPFICINEQADMYPLPHNVTLPNSTDYPATSNYENSVSAESYDY